MANDLTAIVNNDYNRGIILSSESPYDALYRINPELATIAYAHKSEILTPEIMPYIMRFRELQSGEKISLMNNMVKKHWIGKHSENIKYSVDGQVKQTTLIQNGLNFRTEISEKERTNREGIVQNGLTKREEIKIKGMQSMELLRLETYSKALNDYMNGQKYISDNNVKSVQIQAEAYRDAIINREQINADMQRGISQDRLEEKIKTATIEFATKIKLAEIARGSFRNECATKLAQTYIESQTRLCLEAYQMQTQIELSKYQLKEKIVEAKTRVYESRDKTIQKGLETIQKGISIGHDDITLEINSLNEDIKIKYNSKKDFSQDQEAMKGGIQ
ncbi:MAG: hypothetical protein ACP5OG_00770 [Candidatus Nanoarchaeia archaeon]